MDEKLVERLRESTQAMACFASAPMLLWNDHSNAVLEAATALTLAQARIRELEEAIWLAHDQLNTYRSAAVEEVIDKLETYIPGLSGQALKEDQP